MIGLETILNNPDTSFLKNPKTFNEIHSQSKMTVQQMIKHVGKSAKVNKSKEPSDAERAESRLNKMEVKQSS